MIGLRLEESEQKAFYDEKGCIDKKIHCPTGSMVSGIAERFIVELNLKKEKNKNLRNVAYICMTKEIVDAMLNKKRKAFKGLRMTSHWRI